jgi:hypothetical protein
MIGYQDTSGVEACMWTDNKNMDGDENPNNPVGSHRESCLELEGQSTLN